MLPNGLSKWIGGVASRKEARYFSYAGTKACAVKESVMLASIMAMIFGGGVQNSEVTWG